MAEGDRSRRRVIAHGRVQGVFFRSGVQEMAEAHGLSGWARNRGDGSMEACFEGPQGAIDHLVAWCGDGPEGARVTRLDVIEEEPEGIAGFQVR